MATHESAPVAGIELDPEDVALGHALAGMQQIVEHHLQTTGLSINLFTAVEQIELCDQITPYLQFELSQSDAIWQGMPVVTDGWGGVLVADSEGVVVGAQEIGEDDSISGLVDDVIVYPVPSPSLMRGSTGGEVPNYDRSLSAIVVLRQAKVRSRTADAGMRTMLDLSPYRAMLPVVYGLRLAVASQIEVEC